jgi:hypothetical protein
MGDDRSRYWSFRLGGQTKRKRGCGAIRLLILFRFSVFFVSVGCGCGCGCCGIGSGIGASESGKSTILKQMIIIHGHGWKKEEREVQRQVIVGNIFQGMAVLCQAMSRLDVPFAEPANKEIAARISLVDQTTLDEWTEVPVDMKQAIKTLWADSGLQGILDRKSEYQLSDSFE